MTTKNITKFSVGKEVLKMNIFSRLIKEYGFDVKYEEPHIEYLESKMDHFIKGLEGLHTFCYQNGYFKPELMKMTVQQLLNKYAKAEGSLFVFPDDWDEKER